MNTGYNPQQQAPQQPAQPQNQQQFPPQYQPQFPKGPSLIDRIYGRRTDMLQSILVFASILLFILAPIVFLYSFIMGIVDASSAFGTFRTFINNFISGISSFINLFIFGVLLAVIKRVISRFGI